MVVIHCIYCFILKPRLLSLYCSYLLCHSFSFVVVRCIIRCHSLSLVVICCHSLLLVVPLVVTLCLPLYYSLPLVVTCCLSLYHSLSLVVTGCTTGLSFYKRSFLNVKYCKFRKLEYLKKVKI